MGSQFNSPILADQVAKIMKQWHADVRERRRKKQELLQSPRASLSTEWSSRTGSSPAEFSSFPRPSLTSNESIQLSVAANHTRKANAAERVRLLKNNPAKPYADKREIS